MRLTAALAALCCVTGCGSIRHAVADKPTLLMDFDGSEFLDAPFPAEGRHNLSGYPIGARRCQVHQLVQMNEERIKQGFALTGATYFRIVSDERTTLAGNVASANAAGTVAPDFPVLIVPVAPISTPLQRTPLSVELDLQSGIFSVRPAPGFPLLPAKQYAVVVLRRSTAPPLEPSETIAQLASGVVPKGMSVEQAAVFKAAFASVTSAGIPPEDIAAFSAFRTADPIDVMRKALVDARKDWSEKSHDQLCHLEQSWPQDGPVKWMTPLVYAPERSDTGTADAVNGAHAGYCTFTGKIMMPVYQGGTIPYGRTGGYWTWNKEGRLEHQCWDKAEIVVTVPRGTAPAGGFPTVVFVRAGAGSYCTPIVDRQRHSMDREGADDCTQQGTAGPARYFAEAGFAGLSIDGPHTGMRVRKGEGFIGGIILKGEDENMFNILNLFAMRDNIRQSALEVALQAEIVESLRFVPDAACPSVTADTKLTSQGLGLFSHSMGATISPLALAIQPKFKGAIFSGEGGSYVEQVLYKLRPQALRPVFTPFAFKKPLGAHDPVLNLFQWAMEPADPPIYGQSMAKAPDADRRNFLMVQGIVDNYVGVPMANASAISLDLDLAGDACDGASATALQVPRLSDYLPLINHSATGVALPVKGNVCSGTKTAVVVQQQRWDDGDPPAVNTEGEGHETIYEEKAPKFLYRCFLESMRKTGVPTVPKLPASLGDELLTGCGP